MYVNSEQALDSVFLSYDKILKKLHLLGLTTKQGKKITELDLRKAIDVMLEKHPTCRWRSEKIRSRKYFILIEKKLRLEKQLRKWVMMDLNNINFLLMAKL